MFFFSILSLGQLYHLNDDRIKSLTVDPLPGFPMQNLTVPTQIIRLLLRELILGGGSDGSAAGKSPEVQAEIADWLTQVVVLDVGEFGSAVYPSLLDEEKACIGSLLGYVQ